ncbi:MAG TPA: HupE/UreJ family protein, partial [Myxococcales bacterium]
MRTLLLVLLLPAAALAHQSTVSFSELTVRGREVGGVLRFSLADLRTQMRLEDPRHPPLPALIRLALDSFALKASGNPCALQAGATAEPDGEDGLALLARWVCPGAVEELSVRVGFLESFPPGHTHFSRIDFGPNELSQRAAQSDAPSFEAGRTRSAWSGFRRFLVLGIQHIFTGYDHVAFLIGLMLLGGTIPELVKIVTAFTVAHSV